MLITVANLARLLRRLREMGLLLVLVAVAACQGPSTGMPDDTDNELPKAEDLVPHTLSITVDTATLPADRYGAEAPASTPVTVQIDPAEAGLVATLRSDAGTFAATTLMFAADGTASTHWYAPSEADLGTQALLEVALHAEVAVNSTETVNASTQVQVEAAAEGDPVLNLEAVNLPLDLVADGTSEVTVRVSGLRLPAGTAVELSAASPELGTLAETSVTLGEELWAETTFRVGSTPGEVLLQAEANVSGKPVGTQMRFATRAEDAPAFDLTGTWAQLVYGRVKLESGGLDPNPQCVISPTLMMWDVVQRGLEVTVDNRTCRVAMPSVNSIVGLTTTTPGPGFYDAIGVSTSTMILDSGELGTPFDSGYATTVLGADLVDPDSALPTSGTDASVTDPDGDGEPGVTVIVEGTPIGIGDGPMNTISRTRTRARGIIESSTLISGDTPGDIDTFTDTSVLDSFAANAFAPTIAGIPSTHRIVRVDGAYGSLDVSGRDGDASSISCADLLAAETEIFAGFVPPPTPADCGDE